MSEEKKEEKERKTTSIFDELSNISIGLSEAEKMQAQIMQSSVVQQALQSAKIFESFSHIAGYLHSMASINEMLRQNQSVIHAIQQSSAVFNMMREYQSQVRRLADSLTTINKMVRPLEFTIPELTAELTTIPTRNDTLVRSLLREIELLEKELSKEKAKNKVLLALLEKKRKQLKRQYVT